MRRGLWFVAGAVAGVYGTVKARRAAQALSADGLRDRVGAAALGARMLRAEMALGMGEAESDLRERYRVAAGLDTPSARPALRATRPTTGANQGTRKGKDRE